MIGVRIARKENDGSHDRGAHQFFVFDHYIAVPTTSLQIGAYRLTTFPVCRAEIVDGILREAVEALPDVLPDHRFVTPDGRDEEPAHPEAL